MASLERRGKTGTYYAQWYDGCGKQVHRGLETTILRIAKHRLRDLLDGPPRMAAFTTTRTPIAVIVSACIASMRARIADSTQRSHMWGLGDLFGPARGDSFSAADGANTSHRLR